MKADPLPSSLSIFKTGFVLAIFFAAVLGFSLNAQASVGIFQMADGTFYHPGSGMKDASYAGLESRLRSAGLVAGDQTEAEDAAPSAPKVILQIFRMSDGRYFHPASGMLAGTEAEIYRAQGLPYGESISTGDPARDTALLRAVDRAKQGLQEKIDRDRALHGIKTTPTDDIWADVTLAVWNKGTDEIRYVDAKKRGTKLEIASGYEDIFVRRSNYINSEYAISDPNSIVVGVRYPILKSIKAGNAITHYEMHDEAYAPYSRDLHLPETVKAGHDYLNATIDQAFTEMRSANIASRSTPGKLMADVVDKDLIKGIVTIEHTDLWTLQNDPNYGVERFLVTLGLNTKDTYNYSRSSANAFGLAQFIPSTYASFAARTQLGLIPDFEEGLKNHVNAVRAAAAHLDDSLASMPSTVKQIGMHDDKVKEYLAAAYNGGYSKVRTAISIWDEQISGEYQPHEILSRSRLYPETIDYVKKLRLALPIFKAKSSVQLTSSIK